MIDIRLAERTNKERRANIYRKYTYTNETTSKTETNYKFIGSLRIFIKDEDELIKLCSLLEPDEILQLQNWLAEIHLFKESLNVEPDDLIKIELQAPENLYHKIYKIYIEAKRLDIDFIPNKIMLEALFKKAKLTQDRINALNKTNLQIIDWPITASEEHDLTQDDREAKVLFKALLALPQPLSKTCQELEEHSKEYRETQAKIPPPLLREWAGDMPNRNPNKRIKKWAYALAIDVLLENGINPTTLLPAEKIAKYWGMQKKDKYTLPIAEQNFIKLFSIPLEKQAAVKKELHKVFNKF